MRMHFDAFIALRDMLVSRGLLKDSRHLPVIEQIGIFLCIVAFAARDRECVEMFQHSLQTINKYFNATLQAIVAIAPEMIKLPDESVPCSNKISRNSRFWPHFKFIAPYRKTLYHIGQFRMPNARDYRNKKEKFNHRHACLRNVIERSFGILKQRFAILNTMKPFPLKTQRDVVVACFTLHNFIARYSPRETIFCKEDTCAIDTDVDDVELTELQEEGHDHSRVGDRRLGDAIRQKIADDIWGH
ncbi:hypothetical protein AXF42_Ash013932 [Apostasia shenzhenica]|uniref:Uncharacterized protein n=1 Tax=Apostasia shenzhenica TaxID=1088818 RepID=A0A2I0ASI0_9ASPA|nr:hypothetical protein AXF42_Ash013932 [Apostasia shenzhenica]